jgi:hypothetical protein
MGSQGDLIDEDRVLCEHLATFGADALRELEGLLNAPQPYRERDAAPDGRATGTRRPGTTDRDGRHR